MEQLDLELGEEAKKSLCKCSSVINKNCLDLTEPCSSGGRGGASGHHTCKHIDV